MEQQLAQAAAALVQRAAEVGLRGTLANADELRQLNQECQNRIPGWYIELITSLPLCNLELGWQAYESEAGYEGISWMQWSDVRNIRSETLECYPGIAILRRGYINVASDSDGGGDPYFIPADKGEDPPLYQVYHDVSHDPDEMIRERLELVASSLSDFFNNAIIDR